MRIDMDASDKEILSAVTEIFKDNLERKDISLTVESRMDADLLVNSLFLITIIADIEKQYNFRFLAEEIQNLKTVGNIIDKIKEKGA